MQVIDYLTDKVNQFVRSAPPLAPNEICNSRPTPPMSTSGQERVELLDTHRADLGAIVIGDEIHFSAYPIKSEGLPWVCDLCTSSPADGTLEYGNKELNIGCCEACFKPYEAQGTAGLRKCQALLLKKDFKFQHCLSPYFKCDFCEKKLVKGEKVFGSLQLNVDACMTCIHGAAPEDPKQVA